MDGEIDRSPYYSDLWRRFAKFANDNGWYDSMSSYYTPKQNLYRYISGKGWFMRSHKERLGFFPASIPELDMLLTVRGY